MPNRSRLALGLCFWAVASAAAFSATLSSEVTWRDSDERFGGLSSLALDETGTRFFATGDRGILVEGRLTRDTSGRVKRVETVALHSLRREQDLPLTPFLRDAEGIDWPGGSEIYISFEGYHRVEGYSFDGLRSLRIPYREPFAHLQENSSLEALALDPKGRLLTIPERSGVLTRPFPVYRFQAGQWTTPYALPRRGDFLVVGLDTGPDGRLYLLERALRGFFFATRIRAFEIDARDNIISEETVLETIGGTHQNLEGLSVWRDADGHLRLTMISDDNFSVFLTTEIVEYILD